MRPGAIATVVACLVLTGCSGDRDTGEGRRIESVVKHFALSHGPEACDLLTRKAVTTVYGSKTDCVAKAKRFEGQPVEVTFVKISSSTGAHATAKTLDGSRYWTVNLHKLRGRWLIDSITIAQRPS